MRCTSGAGALRGDGNCRRSYSATAPPASNRARQRRTLRGSRPRMSAACSHVRVPLNARMMTSCRFMARSTAAAANTIGTSRDAYGCTAHRSQSGHFTCSRERTDHVLPTVCRNDLALCEVIGYLAGHGQMAWDPSSDIPVRGSHAPRVGAGESRAEAATRRVESASATAAADGDGPDLLDRGGETLEELAEFLAGGAARDRGAVAPPGLQALLGMEESTPMGSARDWEGPAGSDTADEPRQSPLGCTKNPRRAVEARPNGLAGDGFEVHGPASEDAVAGVVDIFEEPRPGSDRVGFLHDAHRDLSSPVRARDTDPQPAPAGASQCHGASDCGMDGAPTARGVRAGGGAPVSHSGPRPSLWRAIFASGQDVGHPGDGHRAPLAVAKRVCRAGDWLDSTGMP